jgi:hypothetical protein
MKTLIKNLLKKVLVFLFNSDINTKKVLMVIRGFFSFIVRTYIRVIFKFLLLLIRELLLGLLIFTACFLILLYDHDHSNIINGFINRIVREAVQLVYIHKYYDEFSYLHYL